MKCVSVKKPEYEWLAEEAHKEYMKKCSKCMQCFTDCTYTIKPILKCKKVSNFFKLFYICKYEDFIVAEYPLIILSAK